MTGYHLLTDSGLVYLMILYYSRVDAVAKWIADNYDVIGYIFAIVVISKIVWFGLKLKFQNLEGVINFGSNEVFWLFVALLLLMPIEKTTLFPKSLEKGEYVVGREDKLIAEGVLEEKVPFVYWAGVKLSLDFIRAGDDIVREVLLANISEEDATIIRETIISHLEGTKFQAFRNENPIPNPVGIMTMGDRYLLPVWAGALIQPSTENGIPKTLFTLPFFVFDESTLKESPSATLSQIAKDTNKVVEEQLASVDEETRKEIERLEASKDGFWDSVFKSLAQAYYKTSSSIKKFFVQFNPLIGFKQGLANILGLITYAYRRLFLAGAIVGVFYVQLLLMLLSLAIYPALMILAVPLGLFTERTRGLLTQASLKFFSTLLWPFALVIAFAVSKAGLFIWEQVLMYPIIDFLASIKISDGKLQWFSFIASAVVGLAISGAMWSVVKNILRLSDDMIQHIWGTHFRAGAT